MRTLRDAASLQKQAPFLIGEWRIDPAAREISSEDETTRVDPKPMTVLCAMAARGNRVVTRQELFDAVWPDAVVIEEALTRCITDLRHAFGESAGQPNVIETIRGTGYRLVPPVQAIEAKNGLSGTRSSQSYLVALAGPVAVGILFFVSWWWLSGVPAPVLNAPRQPLAVTSDAGSERFGNLSGDGLSLLYSARSGNESYQLMMLDVVTGQAFPVAGASKTTSNVGGVWHPDDRTLAFMAKYADTCEIHILEIHSVTSHAITSCEGNFFPDLAWSPDGLHMAYSASPGPGKPQVIVEWSRQDGTSRALTNAGDSPIGDTRPSYSLDGTQLAFVRTASEAAAELMLLERSTGTSRAVTDVGRQLLGLSWLDSEHVVVSSNRSGPFQLWSVPVFSSLNPWTWIPTGTNNAYDPVSSRDGTTLAFLHDRSVVSIFRESDTTSSAIVSNGARNSSPSISPDGSHMAYVSTIGGTTELWMSSIDGSSAHVLTSLGAYVDAPAWSPDGTRILFASNANGTLGIYLLELQSRLVTHLAGADANDVLPSWTPEGDAVLFGSDRSGTWEIWRLDITKPDAVPVPTGMAGFRAVPVPGHSDRKWAVARPDSEGISVYDAGIPLEPTFTSRPHVLDWGAWTIQGNFLFMIARRSDGAYLIRTDSNGVSTEKRVSERAWDIPVREQVLSVAPDGSVFLAREIVGETSILVMKAPGR